MRGIHRYDLRFGSEEKELQYVAGQLRRYHPMGYGTQLRVTHDTTRQDENNGEFHVTGSRLISCD